MPIRRTVAIWLGPTQRSRCQANWRTQPAHDRGSRPRSAGKQTRRSLPADKLNRQLRAVLNHAVIVHRDKIKVYESLRNLTKWSAPSTVTESYTS